MDRLNKSESKYFNTAVKMDKAFLELLGKKDFEFITVKELCEKAKVNRSTFYLHYETIEDLLTESVSYLNDQFRSYFPIDPVDFANKIHQADLHDLYLITPEMVNPYLTFIKENKRIFATVVEKADSLKMDVSYDKLFTAILSPILDRFSVPEKEKNYLMAYFMHGILAIIKEWLKTNCTDSIEFISNIIIKYIPTIYSPVNKET